MASLRMGCFHQIEENGESDGCPYPTMQKDMLGVGEMHTHHVPFGAVGKSGV